MWGTLCKIKTSKFNNEECGRENVNKFNRALWKSSMEARK